MSTSSKTGFTITTIASNGGNIDSASLTLQVSTPATIATGTTSAITTTMISESTTFRLTFSLPIQMDANWGMEITFPADITIVSFSEINGYGALGAKANLLATASVDTTNNKVTITNAVSSYTKTDFNAIVEFVSITNPSSTKTTDSFQLLLKTSSGASIATKTTGITYTASEGSITAMSATPDATTVGISTSVLFSFKPTHKIPVSSQLKVTIPVEASITAKDSTSCSLSNLSQIQLSATCTVSGRVITISNPFSADFIQDGSKTITFKIGDLTMPGTTVPSSAGTFTT